MTIATPRSSFENLPAVTAHVTAIRHDLHQHPELGYEERYTSGVVQRELSRLGIEYQAGLAGGTGVVATLRGGGGDGSCVALRADMDALPIHETTGLSYASLTPGKMHACGHDGHTAILLGSAEILKEASTHFRGTIKLIFQPAEEGGNGAERLCKEGVLERPNVDAIFGLHGWPGLKVGMAATRPGPLLASVDGFTIELIGRGSHAAAPQESVDPIVCGAAIVQALQSVIARETDPSEAAVLTVAQFHAGVNFNVIPDRAELNGTIRALTTARREAIHEAIHRISRGIASAHRCKCEIRYHSATPCTTNTPEMADFVGKKIQEVLGKEAFVTVPRPAMWGEDFAFYLERVPGCFFVLGVQPPECESYPMLHHSSFDFTDAAIPVGIRLMSQLALGFLSRGQ